MSYSANIENDSILVGHIHQVVVGYLGVGLVASTERLTFGGSIGLSSNVTLLLLRLARILVTLGGFVLASLIAFSQ